MWLVFQEILTFVLSFKNWSLIIFKFFGIIVISHFVSTVPSENSKPQDYASSFWYLLEKAMAPHSSTLAWKIPWMEEPGGLQSMGS